MAQAQITETGHTEVWELETQWTYHSGRVTVPTLGTVSRSERIRVHAPLGRRVVVFTVAKTGAKPDLPEVEPDTNAQWLERTEIFGHNVTPNSQGQPLYVIRGAHHYGLASPEEARVGLYLGGVPFIKDDYSKTISAGDFKQF